MQLSVTRRHRSRAGAVTAILATLGLAAGLAGGFALGTLFGTGGHRRVGRLVRSAGRGPAAPERRAVLLDRVRQALAADPELAGESFELLTSGRTGLALHGWVSTRAGRLRAQRTAQAAAGGEPIVNRLLVRGEDDSHVTLVRDDAPRSA
jgi:hypothetical protein